MDSSGVFKNALSSCPFFTWIPPSRLVDVFTPVTQAKPVFPRIPTVPIWVEIWINALPKNAKINKQQQTTVSFEKYRFCCQDHYLKDRLLLPCNKYLLFDTTCFLLLTLKLEWMFSPIKQLKIFQTYEHTVLV